MRTVHALIASACLAAAVSAHADEGALSVDAGGGGLGIALPAPFAAEPRFQLGTAAHVRGGARYALSHWLEVGVGGFWEPSVRFLHREVGITTDAGVLPGALQHQVTRFGGHASARLVFGLRWRFFGQLDVGWSRRQYSQFQAFDASRSGAAVPYSVQLSDYPVDNLLLGLGGGCEFQLTDAIGLSIAPRVEILLGAEPAVGVTVPLLLSWSWML